MRSRSTRPDPRSSPGPNDDGTGMPTASRRSAISSAGPSRFCTTASTTPAGSTPRPARAWDPTRPPSPRPARDRSRRSSGPSCSTRGSAWEVAGSGQLFAEPIPRLRIDRGQNPSPTDVSVVDGLTAHGMVEASGRAAAGLGVAIVQRDGAGADPGDAPPNRQPILPEGRPAGDRGAGAPARSHPYTALLEEGERWPHT